MTFQPSSEAGSESLRETPTLEEAPHQPFSRPLTQPSTLFSEGSGMTPRGLLTKGPVIGLLLMLGALLLLVSWRWFGADPLTQEQDPLKQANHKGLSSYAMPDKLPLTEAVVAQLQIEPGFHVAMAAQGLDNAGMMAWSEANQTLYVARPRLGDVIGLQDEDHDGQFETQLGTVVTLPEVSGIALQGNQLYMATTRTIYRGVTNRHGRVSKPSPLINDLPEGGQHPYRYITIGPDGYLYISIGSYWNASKEPSEENAAVLKVSTDASERTVLAHGLRHTIGIDWHPPSGTLWGMEQGTDWDMTDIPPEELNQIEAGKHYGYPWCFGPQQTDPFITVMPEEETQTQFCNHTEPSQLLYQAHTSPTGFVFYHGPKQALNSQAPDSALHHAGFPEAYRNQAFVAMYGSSHRKEPVGYEIVRIAFTPDGKPLKVQPFLKGFLSSDGKTHTGRPYGLLELPDGSLLMSDEASGAILRITYTGS